MSFTNQNDKGKHRSYLVNNWHLWINFKPRGRGGSFDVELFSIYGSIEGGFPPWLYLNDQKLLQAMPDSVKANLVIAEDRH